MSRVGLVLAVAAIAAAAFFVVRASGGGGRRAVVTAKVPGIVVVCLDTVRTDVVEPGADHQGLPSLRAFRAGATSFDGALAPSSWTAPSVTTLLTGLEPGSHGVLDPSFRARLPASVPTVAAILRAAGFSTAACTGGGWVGEPSGLAAGFDQFSTDFDALPPAEVVARWERRRPSNRPFFLFLHSYAAHDPYGDKSRRNARTCAPAEAVRGLTYVERARVPPADDAAIEAARRAYFELRMTDPCGLAAVEDGLGETATRELWAGCRAFMDGGWRADAGGRALVARVRAAYHAALPHVEARLAATLAALEALPKGTVVVVCSDHGEAFGEHGVLQHGRQVVPELTRAILVIRADGWPAGGVVPATVGLVDVVPTLLDLAGTTTRVRFDGQSLVPVVASPARGRPVASVVTSNDDATSGDEPWNRRAAVRDDDVAWTGTFDRRTGQWTSERWYDRKGDPDEHHPLPAPPVRPDPAYFDAVRDRVRRTIEVYTR
ncbi:MAG: sulfatase-like hydrolase/transferase [Planctomycetota bacterium]